MKRRPNSKAEGRRRKAKERFCLLPSAFCLASSRGFTLIESCAAAALLVAAISLTVALLTSVARQRHGADLHARGVLAADNLLERITAGPYDEITQERAAEVCAAMKVSEQLPAGEAVVSISAESGPPAGKKIVAEILWRASASAAPARHQVVTWVYRAEGRP